MTVILDPELKVLMAQDQTVAVLWQDEKAERTALLAKAAEADLAGFRGRVPIQCQWQLGRYACGSVLRLLVIIFDRPDNPYRFETFINVAAPEQQACVAQLVDQEQLHLHFFDSRTAYVFSKGLANPVRQRQQLTALLALADREREHLGQVWDFDRAKALFQASFPLHPF